MQINHQSQQTNQGYFSVARRCLDDARWWASGSDVAARYDANGRPLARHARPARSTRNDGLTWHDGSTRCHGTTIVGRVDDGSPRYARTAWTAGNDGLARHDGSTDVTWNA